MNGIDKFIKNRKALEDSIEVKQMTFRNVITWQIETAMQQKGITRAQLAKKLRRSKAFVSQVLSGDRNFTVDTLVAIATALECGCELILTQPKKVKV